MGYAFMAAQCKLWWQRKQGSDSFAAAHPALGSPTGRWGSSSHPHSLHALPAGFPSKANPGSEPPGVIWSSWKRRSSAGLLQGWGVTAQLGLGAKPNSLELLWRGLWGPAHISSVSSTPSWIPAHPSPRCTSLPLSRNNSTKREKDNIYKGKTLILIFADFSHILSPHFEQLLSHQSSKHQSS